MWSSIDTELCLIFVVPGIIFCGFNIGQRLLTMGISTIAWGAIGFYCFATKTPFPFRVMALINLYMHGFFACQHLTSQHLMIPAPCQPPSPGNRPHLRLVK